MCLISRAMRGRGDCDGDSAHAGRARDFLGQLGPALLEPRFELLDHRRNMRPLGGVSEPQTSLKCPQPAAYVIEAVQAGYRNLIGQTRLDGTF